VREYPERNLKEMPQNKRLVVQAVDELAQSHPNQCCFSIPKDDDDLSKGFRTVNCKQFANAINHTAAWLKSAIGASDTTPPQVLGYSGPNDLRYPILAVAVAKVGRQVPIVSSVHQFTLTYVSRLYFRPH
jgi:hypothetical protein